MRYFQKRLEQPFAGRAALLRRRARSINNAEIRCNDGGAAAPPYQRIGFAKVSL